MNLTPAEKELLTKIKNSKRFPIVRFELRSSKEASLVSTALNNVWITDPEEPMEQVKANAALLQKLWEDDILNLCYTLRITARSDYRIYYQSSLYKQFCATINEAKQKPGFLFDTPHIKRGVATFTAYGRQVYLANL